MKKQSHDLFAEHHRRRKITQFTKVLDSFSGLVDWVALTKLVNEHTGVKRHSPRVDDLSTRPECWSGSSFCSNSTATSRTKTPNTPCWIVAAGNASSAWQAPTTYPMHAPSGTSRTNSPRQAATVNFRSAKFNLQHWRALPDLLGLKGAQIMEIWYQLTLAHHFTGHPHESPSSARHRNQVACEDRA